MRRCFLPAMLVSLIASSGSAQQNLLTNGSFETVYKEPGPPGGLSLPVGWRRYSFAPAQETTYSVVDPGGLAVDGSKYLQMGRYNALVQVTTQTITADTSYNIAAFMSSYGYAGPYEVRVYALENRGQVLYDGTTQLAGIAVMDASTTMTEYSVSFTPDPGSVGKYLGVYLATHANYYAFDNVRLTVAPPTTQVPEPASAGLLGAGAAFGIIAVRRRARQRAG